MNLLLSIRGALRNKWLNRLSQILLEAESAEGDPQDIYIHAYRKAYWDAVTDMAQSGLIRHVPATKPPEPTVYH